MYVLFISVVLQVQCIIAGKKVGKQLAINKEKIPS